MDMEQSSTKDSISRQTQRLKNVQVKHTKSKLGRFLKMSKKKSKTTSSLDSSEKRSKLELDDLYPPLSGKRNQSTNHITADVIDGGALKFYPMDKRGPLYIINNFAGNENFAFREGGCHDAGKLTFTFEALGFRVFSENNLTSNDMKECCLDWASRNYDNADCIIVAILTHGKDRDLLKGTDGKYVALKDLLSLFQRYNPTLVGKPKIFLVQACRGDIPNIGVWDTKTGKASGNGEVEQSVEGASGDSRASLEPEDVARLSLEPAKDSGFLPQQADRLIAFATSMGHPAQRNTDNGSWYIEELTKVLHEEYLKKKSKKHGYPKHFADILTEVHGRVSNYVKEPLSVQMPEFISNLRGSIYISQFLR